jgi:hypothetical protein
VRRKLADLLDKLHGNQQARSMLDNTEWEAAHKSGEDWADLIRGGPETPSGKGPIRHATIDGGRQKSGGWAIFGGTGAIPPAGPTLGAREPGEPSRGRQAAAAAGRGMLGFGGRLSLATKAATYERLKKKKRTWWRVLLFGTGRPAYATSRPMASKKGRRKPVTLRILHQSQPSGWAAWTPAQHREHARKQRRTNGKFS